MRIIINSHEWSSSVIEANSGSVFHFKYNFPFSPVSHNDSVRWSVNKQATTTENYIVWGNMKKYKERKKKWKKEISKWKFAVKNKFDLTFY